MEGGRDDDDEGQSKAKKLKLSGVDDDDEGLSDAKKFKFSYPADSSNSGSMTSSDAVIAVFDKESDSLLCYKPSTKSWYKMQEMNDEMKWEDLNSVVVEDHIYALRWNESVYLKYSNMNATWQPMADMEEDHGWSPPAAVLNGFIYVVGGSYDGEEGHESAECEVFDPSNDEWKLISSLNEARSDASVVAAKGYIYCIGGSNSYDGDLNSVERYDPDLDTWTYVASMKQPRSRAAAVEFDGKIYVIGGNYYYQPLSDVECYDSASDTWTWIEPMLTSCGWCTACVLDKKIFVFERDVSEQGLQMFDLSDKKWKYFDEVLDIKTQCSVNSLILPDYSNLVPVRKQRNLEVPCVTRVKAVKEKNGIRVIWQRPETNVFLYLVLVFCDGIESERHTISESSYLLEKPESSKKYFFKVCTQNFMRLCGEFSESNVVISYREAYAGNGVYYDRHYPLKESYDVYLGELAGIQPEEVAVKLMSATSLQREKREIINMTEASKRHSNVVHYRYSGEMEEEDTGVKKLYLAMELCERATLNELVLESNLDFEYEKTILLHIMHGLLHIHKNNIIHRDLKPQNVLRSLDKRNIKVADFGLSKKIDPEKSKVSKSCMQIGTEGWGSPEHYMKDHGMSSKSDIFSAGLVFYFVLSKGKHAFDPHADRWKIKIIDGVEMNLSGLQCPDIEIARDMITKMLERDPRKRPMAEEVLKHPFFWDDEKKLQFLSEISDHSKNEPTNEKIIQLEETTVKLVGNNWLQEMILKPEERVKIPNQSGEGPIYEKASEKKGKRKGYRYNHTSVFDLLRFIRNRYHHYMGDGDDMQKIFKDKDDIWKFFSIRFPLLFCSVYNAVMDSLQFKNFFVVALRKDLPVP